MPKNEPIVEPIPEPVVVETTDEGKADPNAVDIMAEAPPERPYHEAITTEHREFLAENGVIIETPAKEE